MSAYLSTVLCPNLPEPDSGTVQLSTDGNISTAEFTCAFGYYLSGSSAVFCQTTGTWSEYPPSCGKTRILFFFHNKHMATCAYKEHKIDTEDINYMLMLRCWYVMAHSLLGQLIVVQL